MIHHIELRGRLVRYPPRGTRTKSEPCPPGNMSLRNSSMTATAARGPKVIRSGRSVSVRAHDIRTAVTVTADAAFANRRREIGVGENKLVP